MVRPSIADIAMDGFERLYRSEGARLERALILFTSDREMARDAVAEAFAQAIAARERLHSPQARVWRAAFRIAAGDLKRRSRRATSVQEDSYVMPEAVIDVVRALSQLSRKQRASIVLHHYAGYPTKDVARMIDSTTAAVTVHLSVGRKRLRSLLEDDDDGS
jgi:DNA-directed RNA polymerase specialized sigma24 family protein